MPDRSQVYWSRPQTFASSLLLLYFDAFGAEVDDQGRAACLSWDPETIMLRLQHAGAQPNAVTYSKLLTAIRLQTSDAFYQRLVEFIPFCNILNDDFLDFGQFDLADPFDIAWGVSEAYLLSPPEDEPAFSPEVTGYIAEILKASGIWDPPDVLKLADPVGLGRLTVEATFADDPVMFEAIQQASLETTQGLEGYIRERLENLFAEVEALPLQRADARNFLDSVADRIQQPSV